ncbi:hypothetical protein CERSUDRAFT_101596 [Gelatoporia subvermispora B]|uniref:Uncharacterized protein n=1 Tax=Ceriporiopsis subvermispora (strain B) TaxID=914234 RepID=M2P508_CERS8|nr:hypothetical protein CERSUDRAFT_101596 [Gelatoporia subvermispora B]
MAMSELAALVPLASGKAPDRLVYNVPGKLARLMDTAIQPPTVTSPMDPFVRKSTTGESMDIKYGDARDTWR